MRKLQKINQWLVMTHFKNDFFNKKIKWQLHSLINWIIYPEFRESWNIKNILKSNKYLIIFLSIVVFLISLSFTMGYSIDKIYLNDLKDNLNNSHQVIDSLTNALLNKDSIILDFSKELKSREYLEFKIIRESRVENISNLKSVPDSIFRLMINEADKYKIPYVIFFRVMERESKFLFISNSGGSSAMGYMQVVQSTFSQYYSKLHLKNGHTPGNNIRVASALINNIHNFWKTQIKNERSAWEYTLAEYACGRFPMQNKSGYFIPDDVKQGIEYVMKYYK